jgi:4-hydroxybenzoate polyprenyltransferase
MSVIGQLLRACHPLPAAAVTVLSGLLALALGQSPGVAALAAATVGLSQLSIGWANDAIDADRDRTAGRPDKPLVARRDLVAAVKIAAWTAAGLTLVAAIAWGWPRGLLVIVALAGAQLYNWPLKGTAASIVPYLVCFAALPAFLSPGVPAWLIVASALLGGSAHLLNAVPDLAADAATGVRGLPQRLGERASLAVASVLLVAATATLVFGARPPWWAGAVALLSSASPMFLAGYLSTRLIFRLVIVVAAMDVVLLVLSGAL